MLPLMMSEAMMARKGYVEWLYCIYMQAHVVATCIGSVSTPVKYNGIFI